MNDLIEVTGNSVKDLRDNLNELMYPVNGIHFHNILWETYRVQRIDSNPPHGIYNTFYSVLVVDNPNLCKHTK